MAKIATMTMSHPPGQLVQVGSTIVLSTGEHLTVALVDDRTIVAFATCWQAFRNWFVRRFPKVFHD